MRVLYLSHRLPFAPNRGDRIRSYHLLEGLRTAAEVTLVSLVHDSDEAAHVPAIEARGIRVHPVRLRRATRWVRAGMGLAGDTPLTHLLLDGVTLQRTIAEAVRQAPPDVVVAYCSGMARCALTPPLSSIPFVLDMVDVDSEKWKSLAPVSRFPRSWVYRREARVLAEFERLATRHAVTTLTVNDKERDVLRLMAPGADILTLQQGIDLDAFAPPGPPPDSATVVFSGVMNYAPNEAGALWLAREVWPRVLAARPDARLQIVGSRPTAAVRALAAATVTVTGEVPHTRDYLWGAAVAVAPLHTARGLQNKVLEALAAGVPVVTTTAVRTGLPDALAPACDTADTPEAFAATIVARLAQTPAERRARAAAVDLVQFSWLGPRQAFVDVVRAAAASRPTSATGWR